MRTTLVATTVAFVSMVGALAHADEVTDALTAAQTAYASGALSETAAAITNASRAVQALQSAKLAAMMPAAIDGWTRTLGEDASGAMAMMGMGGMVGTMVDATYTHTDGRSFTINLSADSPIVASMAGMLGSPQMMAMMGKVTEVGGLPMLDQDGSLSALVANRVLVQAQGYDAAEAMIQTLSTMDFAKLGLFDK